MSLFDNPFGGLFDFNRDGHTDMFEAGLGFAIMQDLFENDEEEIKGDGGACIGELEDLQTQLDELNDRLFNLELAEPEDFFSAAHDRWEAQRMNSRIKSKNLRTRLRYWINSNEVNA